MRCHQFMSALVLGGLTTLLLAWVAPPRPRRDRPADPPTPATSDDLGGSERYRLHLSTDKPIYRPGETVYMRAVVTDAHNGHPLSDSARGHGRFVITDGRDAQTAQVSGTIRHSVLAGAWTIPAGQAGGRFTISAHSATGDAAAEREIEIRAYRPPRLRTQITYLREGYAPGATVQATCEATMAEGGVPDGAAVTVIARVDGREVHRQVAVIDEDGRVTTSFPLPAEITRGDGSLAFLIDDGAGVETCAKTIPILLDRVDVTCYPEGGDLVAGLENRLYLQALRPDGKPADLSGRIIDAAGTELAAVQTAHEGRGRIAFTPPDAGPLRLVIDQPRGIAPIALPPIAEDGVVLRSTADTYTAGEALRFVLGATDKRWVRLVLTRHEREIASIEVALEAGRAQTVTLTPPAASTGVLTATVLDIDGTPLAERLVLRRPRQRLHIALDGPDQVVPGDEVALSVTTTDDTGTPVPATVGLCVSDDAVREMLETRDHPPRLPVMVLLENDVLDLADAAIYLDDDDPLAPRACDLLLATQGWRRFARFEVDDFLAAHGDDARRALAHRTPPKPQEVRGGWDGARRREAERVVAGVPLDAIREDAPNMAVKADEPAPAPAAAPAAMAELAEEVAADRAMAAEDNGLARPLPVVRVYAHRRPSSWQPGRRTDFTETLYWNPDLRTDDTGTATVRFRISDRLSTFRILADGFTADGTLGSGTATFACTAPVAAQPILPLELSEGDQPICTLGLVNNTDSTLPLATPTVTGPFAVALPEDLPTTLPPGRHRLRLPVDCSGLAPGAHPFTVAIRAGDHADTVTRTITVAPRGYPLAVEASGMLEPGATLARRVRIPQSVLPETITAEIVVYPTPLANLTEALQNLIRDPYGCFEQTSSTSYPLVMAQQYFTTHTGVDPQLVRQAQDKLDKAYARLTGFECDRKGYEWFGSDPGHEALTAYGLMQFRDMAAIREIDTAMIARTRDWLLARRDGDGSYRRNKKALDSFGGAPPATTDAYITWALVEAGEQDQLATEIAHLRDLARTTDDSYVRALACLVMAATGDADTAADLRRLLAAQQTDDGHVAGTATSITRSGGIGLKVETTALALCAWLPDNAYAAQVERALRFITDHCTSGSFGSTQATILALRAIVAYDRARSMPKAPGRLQVLLDGAAYGDAVPFDRSTTGAIRIPIAADRLDPGSHQIAVRMDDGAAMPASISIRFHATVPSTSPDCPLRLRTSLAAATIGEGEVTELTVTLRNTGDDAAPTPIAVIGLPAGLEPRHEKLKELVGAGRIASWEIDGRELILYWRQLAAGAEVTVPVECIAAIPGRFTGPANSAWLYYTPEHRVWINPEVITITAKN